MEEHGEENFEGEIHVIHLRCEPEGRVLKQVVCFEARNKTRILDSTEKRYREKLIISLPASLAGVTLRFLENSYLK